MTDYDLPDWLILTDKLIDWRDRLTVTEWPTDSMTHIVWLSDTDLLADRQTDLTWLTLNDLHWLTDTEWLVDWLSTNDRH